MKSKVQRLAILALVCLLAAPATPAAADIIHQYGGGKLRGEIVKETPDEVTIRTRVGVVVISREEIERIEKGPQGKEDLDAPPAAPPAPKPPATPPSTPVAPERKDGPQERAKPTPPAKPATPPPPAAPATPATPETPEAPSVDEAEALKLLASQARSANAEKRQAAYEALARTEAGKAELKKVLEKEVAKKEKAIVDWFGGRKDDLRMKLAALVKARRKEALDFIMDPAKYPEENHGAVAQPEVDRLVAKLRRVYETPYYEVRDAYDELKKLSGELREIVAARQKHFETKEAPDDAEAAVSARVAKMLQIHNVPVDDRDAQIKQESAAAQAFNKSVKTSEEAEERACVDATNRYRMMFGLKALRVDERLVQAARKHSEEMVRLRYFDHDSPVPENRTPAMRCRNEGASFTGENIAMGMQTGEGAFRAWYTSSGHHRNILGTVHSTIGIGRHGNHWTQNFGADALK